MNPIQYHPLLLVTDEELRAVRKSYNLDDTTVINESLDAIQEWTKKQDHLVEACQYLDRNMIERLLILARGSVEGTKLKIDKLFTTRGMMPELNLNKDFDEFQKLLDCLSYTPLPKLNPTDYSRVTVTHFKPENCENFSLLSYLRLCILVGEYRIYYDYNLTERYVIDLKNFTLNIVSKLNPITLKKAEIMCTECFGSRIKGIHLLNAPSFVDKIVFILKQGLKEKVASRLYVHSSYEDFHKEVAKEILPEDFDGDEPSLSKIAEQWKTTLSSEEARGISDRFNKFVSDESKRSEAKFNEEYLGMPGTFKKLIVD